MTELWRQDITELGSEEDYFSSRNNRFPTKRMKYCALTSGKSKCLIYKYNRCLYTNPPK